MSVSRPARCLFSVTSIPKVRPQARCQNFHTSPSLSARKPPPRQLRRLTKAQAEKRFPKYTEEELARLPERYTPQQIEAIKAGEEAVSPEDLVKRGVIRSDVGAVSYFDDFRHTIGVLDRPQPYTGPKDPNPRLMTMNEMVAEVERVEEKLEKEFDEEMAAKPPPEKDAKDRKGGEEEEEPPTFPRRIDILRLLDQTSGTMGSYGKAVPVEQETNYLAPGLPKKFMEDETAEKEVFDEDQEPDPRDPDGQYNKLIKQSGMTLDEIFELKLKVLVSHRVVNQTRLGKIQSVYILCIAGNGDGRLGIGEAKGQESESTLSNARISAIRNMKPIPRYEGRTIFGNVEGKVSAVEVQLMARPPGFGLRCQHLIFEMARAAGIHDLGARVPRSRNKMNTVKAAYQALMKQRIPDEIARARGKKLVDVRKVYYGGRV